VLLDLFIVTFLDPVTHKFLICIAQRKHFV